MRVQLAHGRRKFFIHICFNVLFAVAQKTVCFLTLNCRIFRKQEIYIILEIDDDTNDE